MLRLRLFQIWQKINFQHRNVNRRCWRKHGVCGAGHFAGVQLPVCGVAGVPVFDAGHLDIPVPGRAGHYVDGAAQAVCAVVPVQLCGGLFLRQAAGCVWCVAALPTLQLGLAHLLLCGQLPGHRAGHCAVQPVQAADHPDGSVCPGPFGDYPQALRQGQDDHGPDLRCGIHCADRSGYRYAEGSRHRHCGGCPDLWTDRWFDWQFD